MSRTKLPVKRTWKRGLRIAGATAAMAALALLKPGCSDPPPIVGMALQSVVVDPVALNYVVKSVIYPEDPNTMFLTLRGGGISVYDVSNPAAPTLRTRWDSAQDVEGQDRLGGLLVVVARAGKLLTFDVSDPDAVTPIAEVTLDTDPSLYEEVQGELLALVGNGPFDALHVALDVGLDGHTYAFVTATATGELIAVDVTNPALPVQVGALDTDVEFIEGIYIKDHHAFVGGFGSSDAYRSVDVSDPANMAVVKSLSDPAYRQMVPEMKPSLWPNVLFAALWNTEGGLGTFNVVDPANFTVIDTLVRPELEQSNRVKLTRNYAFLPLEQEPGGFAIVDAKNPANLKLTALATGIVDVETPYTLEIKNNYAYVFGSATDSMAIFQIQRAPAVKRYGVWKLGPSTSLAALAAGGVPADQGQGELHFLDPADTGATGTAAHTSTGTVAGIGYVALAPGATWAPENGLWLRHELPYTFYGNVLQYTLVYDLYVPESEFDTNGCYSGLLTACNDVALHQLDRRNEDDADLFLKVGATFASDNGFVGKSGDPLTGGGLGGYAEAIEPDTWHRVAMVVDFREATGQARVYVDGTEVLLADAIDYAKFAAVAEGDPNATGLLPPARDGFLLFADNDGEMDATVYLSSVLFVDRAMTAAQVAAMGPPTAAGIPAP
jgi:hypothetical protein